MRGGKLDRTIVIERPLTTVDDNGTPSQAWTEIARVRAQRIQASTEEFMRTFGTNSQTIVVYRIRYVDGLTLSDRVREGVEIFDVKEIKEIGRRKSLELRCTAAGA
jgi:head-tail adaptor